MATISSYGIVKAIPINERRDLPAILIWPLNEKQSCCFLRFLLSAQALG
jgi:hypothetical protein